jgi:2-amino-4-hydroxy-6-hydroxymethyldihydropteridine diphosphokinase
VVLALSFLLFSFQIRTTAAPLTLLDLIKNVERTVGRVPSIRNGPRAVDLDILFYDDAIIDTRPESLRGTLEGLEGHLVVPHPRIAEREFVLRPLQESASCTLPFYLNCSCYIQHGARLCSSRAPQTDSRNALR